MKKLVSLVTILCVFALMFTFNASAEGVELVWSSIENNASGVAINADLELEFSADVDISKLSLENIALNGSFDCVENESLADGTIDGFVWDETTYTLTIDFKDFSYGKRYIVDLINVPFVGTEETYTGTIAFTTEIPSGSATSVEYLDASKEKKLTWYVWWADSSSYVAEEQANTVNGGAETRYNDAVTNWKEANAIVVEGRGPLKVSFSNAGDGVSLNDGNTYWSGVAALSDTEYTKVTIPFTYNPDTAPDSTYVWVSPKGGINPAYLRSIEFVNIP